MRERKAEESDSGGEAREKCIGREGSRKRLVEVIR